MHGQLTRRALLAAGGAAALTGVAGCATGGISNREAVRLAPGATGPLRGRITVWSWDSAAAALTRLAKKFEARHPGTAVHVVDIGYDNAYDKITVGLRADTGLADLLTVEGSQLPAYIGNFPKGLHDLTDLVGRHAGDFDKAAWKTVVSEEGRAFALPWDIGPLALYYRSDLFARAGVDPHSLRTWDDYVKAGVAVKEKTGTKLLIMDPNEDSFFPCLLQQQGHRWYKDGGKVALGTPQAVRALTLIKALGDRGLIRWERGWDGLVTATKEGKVASTPYAAWWSGTLTGEMPELKGKFGVVPLPAFTPGGPRTSNDGGSTLCIPAQSKNPRLAWAFTRFLLTDKDNQVSMLKREGLFPAYLPALKHPYLSAPQDYYGGQRAWRVFADLAPHIPPVERNKDGAKAKDIANKAVSGAVLRGHDPAGELRAAAAQLAGATGRETVSGSLR
ncbi:ABC transporter substrate-binding protein [Streptomyces iconiensis]|uniref:Sugar ABC transporter substrate-binding protein n=1 Tax=Streptomyces iconiensis TaxID=1384038 RepID=A0ABT6ZZ29_9ACTN|nr:sugar ABC transporter substrate-binding protein [Streptomyces iconiensis]MDJ1134296.1 sugar ABC transporter substrate-binding protein [Streptomyces iconiensis]